MAELGMDDLDLEVWLPAEFLTDEDVLTDFKIGLETRDDFSYGFGNPFGGTSDLSLYVPSAAGTTETESDEDDSISELSRNLARASTLHDSSFSSEGRKTPGSPQSTLCGCKPTPTGGVCKPQDGQDVRRWDLLRAAAKEAARMRMIEETAAFYSTKPISVTESQQSPNPIPNFMNCQTLAQTTHHRYHELQAARLQLIKEVQMMRNGGGGRPQRPSMAGWSTLQQPGSGMTAVFLEETGRKKERTGTGVFMPRRFGSNSNQMEARKKSGCSTVLLPDKVVHALNLNLDPMVHPRIHGHDAATVLKQRNTSRAILRSIEGKAAVADGNQELRLPQEWTYSPLEIKF